MPITMSKTKQLKITKMYRKKAAKHSEDDCDDLQEEIQQLEQRLKEKQDYLFQLERNQYKRKLSPPKTKEEMFIRPQKIILSTSIEHLKQQMELMAMLTGIEVTSYVAGDHCCVLYHMQHSSEHEVKHGLKIDMNSGVNELSKLSLPLGFNLDTVLEGFDNVMLPECLGAIRAALVAYYDRLEQYEKLKTLLNIEAQLFKLLDGSHIEVTFIAHNTLEEDDKLEIKLLLDYRVFDVRPKHYSFKVIAMADDKDGVVEVLKQQAIMFKTKPLHKAFKEVFITGIGPYKMVEKIAPRPKEQEKRPKKKSTHLYQNNDDTFRPEDCSDTDEEPE